MRAAIVSSFDHAPRGGEAPEPTPADHGELVLDVLAAGLHPRVRSQADGSHYTSSDELPLIPGVDGVGRDADGALRFFVLGDTAAGSMAERVAVDPRRTVVLPDDSDSVALAAAMNPAMSSWVALRRRIGFEPGQEVLVHGATGNAGRMAIQVAKLLGARRVGGRGARRATARHPARSRCRRDREPARRGRGSAARRGGGGGRRGARLRVGRAAAAAMAALVTARVQRSVPLTWVAIGSMGGLEAPVPSAALRAARLQIVGSGQGSMSTREIAEELGALAERVAAGDVAVEARAVALADVERAWGEPGSPTERVVIVP